MKSFDSMDRLLYTILVSYPYGLNTGIDKKLREIYYGQHTKEDREYLQKLDCVFLSGGGDKFKIYITNEYHLVPYDFDITKFST